MGATLAVIGLGRIGAFNAETPSGLAGVDELVVTDERPEVTTDVAERLGARAVPDAQAALAAGVVFAEAGDVAPAQTLLTFDNGTLGVVSNTRYNGRGHDCRLELHGSADTVVAGWDSSVPVRNLAPGETFPHRAPHQFRFAEANRAELGAFLDVAMGRRASPCPPEEALEVAWIAEAATLVLHQHRPIKMDEVRS